MVCVLRVRVTDGNAEFTSRNGRRYDLAPGTWCITGNGFASEIPDTGSILQFTSAETGFTVAGGAIIPLVIGPIAIGIISSKTTSHPVSP